MRISLSYRASLMLFEEGKTDQTKQRIGYVVGHELAHLWFGNRSPWSGGRSSGSTRAGDGSGGMADELYPEWSVWSQFLVNEQSMGLGPTASGIPPGGAHRVGVEVNEIFDAISYSKGSCVIRALESHLGEETFREGMRRYVKKHQFANVNRDLWRRYPTPHEDVDGVMSC